MYHFVCATSRCLYTFAGFKRSSKQSHHRERISFSSIRMLPAESLMTLDLLPRKRRIVCQTICLPKHIWTLTNDQTLPITSPWISLVLKLPLFASQCTGNANQMTICPVAKPWTHSFFNLLVPSRCSFLTIARYSKPVSPKAFSSW